MIERAGVELSCLPDKLRTADRRQHAIENARVGFFVGDRAAGNSFADSDPDRRARLRRRRAPVSCAMFSHSASDVAKISFAARVMAMKRATASRFARAHSSSKT